MKKLLTIIYLILCSIAAIHAQGTVTVTQSSDIDAIVNGKKAIAKTKEQLKAEKKAAKQAAKDVKKQVATPRLRLQEPVVEHITTSTVPSYTPQKSTSSAPRTKLVKKLVKRPHVPTPEEIIGDGQMVTKRLMHTIKKVRGFRVQVYSGGNTRIAHQEADKAGQKVKMFFPNLPVYVHFYTPRWMCLVGNFTNYRQARKVALKMRKEGYPNANVIRTMISVKTTKVVGEPSTYDETSISTETNSPY